MMENFFHVTKKYMTLSNIWNFSRATLFNSGSSVADRHDENIYRTYVNLSVPF